MFLRSSTSQIGRLSHAASDELPETFVLLEARRGHAARGKNNGPAFLCESDRALREKTCDGIAQTLFVVLRTGRSERGCSTHRQPRAYFPHIRRPYRRPSRRPSVVFLLTAGKTKG